MLNSVRGRPPKTQPTNIPVAFTVAQRRKIELVARLQGLRLSTWVRVAALERSSEILEQRRAAALSGELETR